MVNRDVKRARSRRFRDLVARTPRGRSLGFALDKARKALR